MIKCIICNHTQKYLFTRYYKYNYYLCNSCKLISTYPFPTKKIIEDHYKKKFQQGNYQLLRQYSIQYKRVYENFVVELKQALTDKKNNFRGLKVLDIGCFTGEFLEILKKRGADVYGIELQEEAVKIANKKLGGRVYKLDIMENESPNMEFDIISLLGIIEHVTDPIKLLLQCSKLLKKDGILLIQTPNSGSVFAKVMKKYWPPFAPVEHIHLFSRISLQIALEKQNFKEINFKQSWKKLPIGYVFSMLQYFGPEFYKIIKPFEKVADIIGKKISLPFYIGEMIIIAKKKQSFS